MRSHVRNIFPAQRVSGVCGAFAKLAEKGAEMFGAKAAIDVLEEGDAYAARS